MKVYFKESQFPDVAKYCKTNPTLMLNSLIEYIPSDKNYIFVDQTAEDQDDFASFFDEITRYVEYIIAEIVDNTGEMYLALLEDMGVEEIPKLLFFREFKVEGVDWFAETTFAK